MAQASYNDKKILIVLLGALGDVTRGLSLAVRIKEAWPECQLCWAVEPKSREIVEALPQVDKVFVFDRPRGFKAYLQFVAELKREKFDLVLDLQRHLKSGFTSWSTGAAQRVGFNRRNAKEFNWLFNNQHIPAVENFSSKIEHYHLFGDLLGLPRAKPYRFGLSATVQQQEKIAAQIESISGVKQDGREFVALILGSTWPSRFWFSAQYQELIASLSKERKVCFLLVGGPSEAAFAEEVAQGFAKDLVVNLVSKTSLGDLLAVFAISDLAIGSDSGPMHIAAAVGTPVISLWGSTSPLRSAPYGNEDLVLQSPVACAPCYRKNCPGLATLCMSEIPSKAVFALANSRLAANTKQINQNSK